MKYPIGGVAGHWIVTADLGRRPRPHELGREDQCYRVKSACGGVTKEVTERALTIDSKRRERCVHCAPRARTKYAPRAPRDSTPHTMRVGPMHRCHVLTHGTRAPELRCGAVVRAEELAQHLLEVHGLESEQPRAWFSGRLGENGREAPTARGNA